MSSGSNDAGILPAFSHPNFTSTMSNDRRIITPEDIRNHKGPPLPAQFQLPDFEQAPPRRTLGEMIAELDASLTEGLTQDLSQHPRVLTFKALKAAMLQAGLTDQEASRWLPKIKIAVPASFTKHALFGAVTTKVAQMVARIYNTLKEDHGEAGALLLMDGIVADSIAIGIPG